MNLNDIITKPVLTDVDGVFLNFDEAFQEFMKDKGCPLIDNTAYDMSTSYGLSEEEADAYASEFINGDIVSNLEPHKDSVEYVQELASLGYRFTCITSISSDPLVKEKRKENLLNVFGDVFLSLHCIDHYDDKSRILSRWEGSGLPWIEDTVRNAIKGSNLGLTSLLVNSRYNLDQDLSGEKIIRVSQHEPWKDIYDVLTKRLDV